MNSFGEFREGEIDGKPFLIYTLSHKDSSTSSSSGESAIGLGGDDDLHRHQPLFLCPSLRIRVEKLKQNLKSDYVPCDTSHHFPRADQQIHYLLDSDSHDDDLCKLPVQEENDFDDFLSCDTSPHFSSSDQQIQYLLDSDSHDDICKLPVVPLYWCNNKEYNNSTFSCGACNYSDIGTDIYLCPTCDKRFHKECVESPLEIKHPSHPCHPFLSLQLCNNYCGLSYRCPTYELILSPFFAMKPIPIVIDHSKRHPHPLTFFPKQASLPCAVCGMVKQLMPTYVCVRCVYAVHQECIYFPNVIKISRHHHPIYFTFSLPAGNWYCGVCRQKVDNYYGAYSCNKCCDYYFHTRCALREDLWDGIDLEGVPEEPETIVEPFETIADGIILHFSHGHHLKLEICRVYNEDKFCQACILPIYEGNYFSCMDKCDFILHETCANAPCKIHHALHSHPLTLKVVTIKYDHNNRYDDNEGYFRCNACQRLSCSFVYEFSRKSRKYRLDVRCASVAEPFEYQGHEHPLFLALTLDEEKLTTCQICQEVGDYCRRLNCIECNYIICFKCATLPYKAMYKHDKHFLTFSTGKDASDHSGWCEVCETELLYSRKGGFYACGDCCTTLHVHCLLGVDPYLMKPDIMISYANTPVYTYGNNTMTRPICTGHLGGHRCPYRCPNLPQKSRNAYLFQKKCSAPILDVRKSIDETNEWLEANYEGNQDQSQSARRINRDRRWIPPPSGWLKCNFDSTHVLNRDYTGVGWIVRDHQGVFIQAGTARLKVANSSLQAEAFGFLHSLQVMWANGYRKVYLEGDNQELTNLINKQGDHLQLGTLLSDIRFWMAKLPLCSLDHVNRERNSAADKLSRKASDTDELYFTFHTPPRWLEDFLYSPFTV